MQLLGLRNPVITGFLKTFEPHYPTQAGILSPGFGVSYVKYPRQGSNL